MKTNFRLLLLGFIMAVFGVCPLVAEDANNSPTLAVAPFTGSKAQVPGWQPAQGQGISEMLIEALENSDNKFQVLETTGTSDLQTESKAGASNSAGSAKSAKRTVVGSSKSAKGDTASSEKGEVGAAASSEDSDTNGDIRPDFTLYGVVTQFRVQTNSSQIGDFNSSSRFANAGAKAITAHVQIAWHIEDAASKRIIKRGLATGYESGPDLDASGLATAAEKAFGSGKNGTANNIFGGLNKAFGIAPNEGDSGDSVDNTKSKSGATPKSAQKSPKTQAKAGGDIADNDSETIGYDNPDFMNSALGKATAKTVTNLIEQLAAISLPEPARVAKLEAASNTLKHSAGKVLAVAGQDTIIVSLGSKEGFKVGDKLNLYEPTDVKDDKGNVVFTDEKLIGEITLESVQEDRSRASFAGNAAIKQDWTVKAK